jgi:polyhydroxyalkanoate synthase
MPVYIYGSREDHIVPLAAPTPARRCSPGKKRFVMGASGHIAGVINPPAAKEAQPLGARRRQVPQDVDEWIAGATETPGSWWTDWADWLKGHAGKQVAAPKAYGNGKQYPAIEPAPGRYVKAKA